MLCSFPNSYEHLVTTLTYGKDTISLEEITITLMSHYLRKKNAGECSQGEVSSVSEGESGMWEDTRQGGFWEKTISNRTV